ncbi:hypothetical protein CRE_31315 [Caenorhabditis remanei]|uniref:SET domain-containing protein n=1 Tax=Caenorhabditis remanei TaxID=31234 RepID=E3MLT6_CAERE|nr:hypothetical protein CRE_31315 [Caenorhabditis remanei]
MNTRFTTKNGPTTRSSSNRNGNKVEYRKGTKSDQFFVHRNNSTIEQIATNQQGITQNIGGKQIHCIEKKSTMRELWRTAKKVDELRKTYIKNRDITAPTDEMMNQVVSAVYRRISEITSLLLNEKLDETEGRKFLMRNSRIQHHLRNVKRKRDLNKKNKKFEPEYKEIQKRLQSIEKEFNCKCPGGNCNKNCPCASLDAALRSGLIDDPFERRHHSCNKECGCKGKCSQSFQEPPRDGTEIVLHSETRKGCAVRSKQYFGQGETVAEIRGQIVSTSELLPQDEYGFDTFVEEIDVPVLKQLFVQNKKNRTVEAITEEYEKTFQKIFETELSINPRQKSNEGRFISCSCFGNTKSNLVFQKGLNPANIRVMFTSLMPIYPNQEITYCYSPQYICHQLKDVCLCGELCCISNRELFPFITKKNIHEFYKTLYSHLHEEYIKNINRLPKNGDLCSYQAVIMQSSKFNNTPRNTGVSSRIPISAPTNNRQSEEGRNLPLVMNAAPAQPRSARVRGPPAKQMQSKSSGAIEDVITLSSDEDDILLTHTDQSLRFSTSASTNKRRLGEVRNLPRVAQRYMNQHSRSPRLGGPPANGMQSKRSRENEDVITLSSDEDDILDDFGMEIEEVQAEEPDMEIIEVSDDDEPPTIQPLKKMNQPAESTEKNLRKQYPNVLAVKTESKQKVNIASEPKDSVSNKPTSSLSTTAGKPVEIENLSLAETCAHNLEKVGLESSEKMSKKDSEINMSTMKSEKVSKHQMEPFEVMDESMSDDTPTKNDKLIKKNVTFKIEELPEIKKDLFSNTEKKESSPYTSSAEPVPHSSFELKEVKKLNSLTKVEHDSQQDNTETEGREGPPTVQNTEQTSDTTETGLKINSEEMISETNVRVEKKRNSGIEKAKTPALVQMESMPSSSSSVYTIVHTLEPYLSAKIEIGTDYQVIVPETLTTEPIQEYIGREDREELLWTPREEVIEAEEEMFYKRTHTVYWFAIWRQFKGHIPYEIALQNLMENRYQMAVSLDSVDQYLERLPEKLKELCMAQAKVLATIALSERTTMEQIKMQAMKNYELVDVWKYYFRFIKYALLNGGHEVPCVCDQDLCRPIDFASRVTCTNCTKNLRNSNGRKSLCLICKTYEQITGEARPANRVIFSNDETKFLDAWREREEALGKVQSKEQIENMLRKAETSRWKRLDLTDEEKQMLKEKHYNIIGLNDAQIARKKSDICNQLKPFVLPLFVDCKCLKHQGVVIKERPNWNKKQNLVNPEIPGAEFVFDSMDDPWFDSSKPMPSRRSLRLYN